MLVRVGGDRRHQDEKFINGSIITDVTSGGGSDGERGHRAEGSYGSTSGRTAVDRRVAQTFERDLGLTNRFFFFFLSFRSRFFDIYADIFFPLSIPIFTQLTRRILKNFPALSTRNVPRKRE